ncbi:hypothetical protein, partial [Solemya velum gill symbiont]|uniref:hypothetical protein n=1 Tax=Solemya velum gill symbiont TaxID=2340 RepID=UPI001C4E20E5
SSQSSELLLGIFNYIWTSGSLPSSWKEVTVIPIPELSEGSTLSDKFQQEMGIPQGGVFPARSFSIKINGIVSCMKSNTEGSLYVDDFSISYRSKHLCTMKLHIQQCLNKLDKWPDTNGFNSRKQKLFTCIFVNF